MKLVKVKSVAASSVWEDGFEPENILKDAKPGVWGLKSEWASRGTAGEWVKLCFNKRHKIVKIVLRDRFYYDGKTIDLNNNFNEGTIEFLGSKAKPIKFDNLPQDGNPLEIPISPAVTCSGIVITAGEKACGDGVGLSRVKVFSNA